MMRRMLLLLLLLLMVLLENEDVGDGGVPKTIPIGVWKLDQCGVLFSIPKVMRSDSGYSNPLRFSCHVFVHGGKLRVVQ
jgi:hypothetical protein